jgi:hypothetical protein
VNDNTALKVNANAYLFGVSDTDVPSSVQGDECAMELPGVSPSFACSAAVPQRGRQEFIGAWLAVSGGAGAGRF